MLVTIRHLPREAYRDMSCIYDENERLQFAKEQLKNNNYVRVAEFEPLNDSSIDELLSIAYEITNSLQESWYLSGETVVSEIAKGGCRSTSVGDIIQIRGASFMVDSFGFTELRKKVERK